jgi:hypothetical protein
VADNLRRAPSLCTEQFADSHARRHRPTFRAFDNAFIKLELEMSFLASVHSTNGTISMIPEDQSESLGWVYVSDDGL